MMRIVIFVVLLHVLHASAHRGHRRRCRKRPDPEDCHGYICVGRWRTFHRKCPGKLVWDNYLKRCNCAGRVLNACVDGGWSSFGPWSACNKLCGKRGIQKQTRTCTNPSPAKGGRPCVGRSFRLRSCNKVNCPKACGFDGVVIQLVRKIMRRGLNLNNHMITAISEIEQALDSARTPYSSQRSTISNIPEDALIQQINALISGNEGMDRARSLMGLLLSKAPSHSCNYEKVVKKLMKVIGKYGMKEMVNANGTVTLVFAIDITRSMSDEILEAASIAKKIAGYKLINEVDYVLSTFSEDSSHQKFIGKSTRYDKLGAFVKALDNLAGQLQQGGDCPEPTYAGIIKGIEHGHPKPGSPMFVFTDAPPKNFKEFTKDRAIYQAQRKKIAVNFFLSEPLCNSADSRSVYKAITEATGGFALPLKSVSSTDSQGTVVQESLQGTTIIKRKTITFNPHGKRSIKVYVDGFDVDDIANQGTLQVVVENSDSSVGIKLLSPGLTAWPHTKQTSDNRIWEIAQPAVGRWKFEINGSPATIHFTVKSYNILDITFHASFLKEGTFIEHPLIGEKCQVKLKVPNLSRLKKTSLVFTFPGGSWNLLSHKEDYYIYESTASLTGGSFKIIMDGKTQSGYDFSRESSQIIHPKAAVIRSLMSPAAAVFLGKTVTYKASLHYTGTETATFELEVKYYKTPLWISAKKETLTVSKGERSLTYQLPVPNSIPYNIYKVRINAKSTALNLELNLETSHFAL